jgi:hypothetical protein
MRGIWEVRHSLGGCFNYLDHLKGNHTQIVDIYIGIDSFCMSRTQIYVSSIFHFISRESGGEGGALRCQKNETLV